MGGSWALLEYGHECFCGFEDTDITRLGSATCDRPCEGDSSQMCGGSNAMTAIAICESYFFVPPQPTQPNPTYRRHLC